MEDTTAEFRRHSRRLFSVFRAIVRRSSPSASGKQDLAARLESRVDALGRVHEMIMRSPREGIDFEELVHGELLAQAIPATRVQVAGPDTRLSGEAGMSLALALHELAVNSVIHGGFLDGQGSIDVSWQHESRADQPWLQMVWIESGGQEPGLPPTQRGFGLELLERTLPYELDACTRVEWLPSGIRVEIGVPGGSPASNWTRGERIPPP